MFRVIRDSDIEVAEEAEDLVRSFQSALRERDGTGSVIRLKIEEATPPALQKMVRHALGVKQDDTTEVAGIMGIADLAALVEADRPDLKFEPYTPRFPERVREFDGDVFAAVRAKDFIVHHPYESFDVVLAFVRQAVADPRRGGDQTDAVPGGQGLSPIVKLADRGGGRGQIGHRRRRAERALRRGAEHQMGGIARARGRPGRLWFHRLEDARQAERWSSGARTAAFRTYCHFGTGNYHPVTARIYTDLSFFTADPVLAADAGQVMNFITGYVEPTASAKSWRSARTAYAPRSWRESRPRSNMRRPGRPAEIWVKLNALVDTRIIDKLYEASAAGVQMSN